MSDKLKIIFIFLLLSPLFAQVQVTHGPIVGAVTSQSARFVVRTGTTAEIMMELSTDSLFTHSISSPPVTSEAVRDFFVQLDVQGLQEDTRYYYRVVLNGVPQPLAGSFFTFPLEGTPTTFTFAFGACQQAAQDPNSMIGRVFPLIARDRPRFFLQLGDWTYPDTTDTQSQPTNYFNTVFSRIQENYRSKYDPGYPMSELFRVAPIGYVYDDHDYSNNDSDMSFPARENSIRGYLEMFPHYPLANPDHGLWHKFTFANADFFFLDTRTQRHPNALAFKKLTDGKLKFEPGPEHLILQADPSISGELQMDWLIRELQNSTATWKFICTSVPFNPANRALLEFILLFQGTEFDPFPTPFGPISAAGLALGISDSWNGFPASAQRLVRAVHDANIENVIVLSGDSHTAAIDDGSNALFPEVMAGGLDRTNSRLVAFAELLGIKLWNPGGQSFKNNNFNSHYGRITVFGEDSVRMEIIDEFGQLIIRYNLKAGHRVSTVALTHVAEGRDFRGVGVGSSASFALLLINTGVDTVWVTDIKSSTPQFSVSPTSFTIPPGERRDATITFQPDSLGVFHATITIESNDPQSPFHLEIQGRGIQPTLVEDHTDTTPEKFTLEQNFPNPFNATTRIFYKLAKDAQVTLRIYNIRGQVVKKFIFSKQKAGRYFVNWDSRDYAGRQVASGVYFYQLLVKPNTAPDTFAQTKKMLLIR